MTKCVGKVSLTFYLEHYMREGTQNLCLWISIIVYVKPDYADYADVNHLIPRIGMEVYNRDSTGD